MFTLVSAGFPALATTIFGIRFQGDFGGDALRSLATADTLGQIDHELRKDPKLSRAADLTEQAARFMLSDLDEWQLVNGKWTASVTVGTHGGTIAGIGDFNGDGTHDILWNV